MFDSLAASEKAGVERLAAGVILQISSPSSRMPLIASQVLVCARLPNFEHLLQPFDMRFGFVAMRKEGGLELGGFRRLGQFGQGLQYLPLGEIDVFNVS